MSTDRTKSQKIICNLMLKISTGIWSAQHPNAGRNIQQQLSYYDSKSDNPIPQNFIIKHKWENTKTCGLGEEWTTFFRKGARSNPAANSKHFFERIGNEKNRQARRPVNDH